MLRLLTPGRPAEAYLKTRLMPQYCATLTFSLPLQDGRGRVGLISSARRVLFVMRQWLRQPVCVCVCVCVSDRHDEWMYVVPYSIDLRPRVYVAISE